VTQNALVSPIENVIDSLTRITSNLNNRENAEVPAYKGALAWGWHAVRLLFNLRVLPHRNEFDQWVRDFFREGSEEISLKRDLKQGDSSQLGLLQILDFLSESSLDSLNLEFYQGWRDKATRCREIRNKTFGIIVDSINEPVRDQLLYLLAVHNRFSNVPSPIPMDFDSTSRNFPALVDLLSMLWDETWDETRDARRLLEECKAVLKP